MNTFKLAVALVSVGALVACGDSGGSGGEGGAGGGAGGTDTTTTTTTTTTGTGGSAPETCGDLDTRGECIDCCADENEDAIDSLNFSFVTECGCVADATCVDECGDNVCIDEGELTDDNVKACIACLNGIVAGNPCIQAAVDDCVQATPSCLPFFECRDDEGCLNLPQ